MRNLGQVENELLLLVKVGSLKSIINLKSYICSEPNTSRKEKGLAVIFVVNFDPNLKVLPTNTKPTCASHFCASQVNQLVVHDFL